MHVQLIHLGNCLLDDLAVLPLLFSLAGQFVEELVVILDFLAEPAHRCAADVVISCHLSLVLVLHKHLVHNLHLLCDARSSVSLRAYSTPSVLWRFKIFMRKASLSTAVCRASSLHLLDGLSQFLWLVPDYEAVFACNSSSPFHIALIRDFSAGLLTWLSLAWNN